MEIGRKNSFELTEKVLQEKIEQEKAENYSDLFLDPQSLSATELARYKYDRQGYMNSLIRPLPTSYNRQIERGNLFHQWVENFYKKKITINDEESSIEESTNFIKSSRGIEKELSQEIEYFRKSDWTKLKSIAIEEKFTVKVKEKELTCKIDAIFKDPNNSEKYIIVDWKTGGRKPDSKIEKMKLQLSVYRYAFSKAKNINPNNISARFYFASEKDNDKREAIFSSDKLMDEKEIEKMF
jgi:DNA helicase-2/ATP-dependent DNA helicase PcrA